MACASSLCVRALFTLQLVEGKVERLTGRNVKQKPLHKLLEGVAAALARPVLGNPMGDWRDSQFVPSLFSL